MRRLDIIEVDWSKHTEGVELLPLSDVHWEDGHADQTELERWIDWIRGADNRYFYIGGDLFNVATRTSVSGIFGNRVTLQDGIDEAAAFISPIADRCIGAVTGNHERRIHKHSGMDPLREFCRRFDIIHDADALYFKLKVGKGKRGKGRSHAQRPNIYTAFCIHGAGGGRMWGGKVNRMASMATMVQADIYFMSHTHSKVAFKESFGVPDLRTNRVNMVEQTFVNTSALLNWGGYPIRGMYKASAMGSPSVRLGGYERTVQVTL